MKVMAFDLATHSGWACGSSGEQPRSGVITLKKAGARREVAFANFVAWLQERIPEHQPDLIVKEAPLALEAFHIVRSSEDNVRIQFGLHAILEAMAERFGVDVLDAPMASVRKHFIGHSHMGERAKTKGAVVQRCHVLGYMPKDCMDDNRADALAVWDWACAVHGRQRPKELVMFGEESRE